MSNSELVGNQFRNDFCGAKWKTAEFKVETDKNCEATFTRIFSKGTNGLSDTKINPAGLSEMDVFIDSFQLVGNQATSLCKAKAEGDSNSTKARQLDEYLRCTRDIVMGKTQLIGFGDKFSFERMVQHLHDRASISGTTTHKALNIEDRAKSWPFLKNLYEEALKLTPNPEQLAPKIEYNLLRWADKAEVLRPMANHVYIYEVKDDGQVIIKPVPETIFDPRAIGLDIASEQLPGVYKRFTRNIFAEIRKQYFEKSNVSEFHPEIERRIAMETTAFMKELVLPDEAPMTFLMHMHENYTPSLQLNNDRKTIKNTHWDLKGELARANQALTPNGSGSFWKLAKIWHQAEIAAYNNCVPIPRISGEFHSKFANQLIEKFKNKLDGETEDDCIKTLSRYVVETVKHDGTIVFD